MCAYDTEVLPIDEISLGKAKDLILSGELVAFPTETVYGLGADATNGEAIKKIFAAKGRPGDNPLIVHVHSDYDVDSLVENAFSYVGLLREKFLPGPLTMVYKSKGVVSDVATCGLDTVGIRVPSDGNAQKFLRAVGVPIAAPSANASKHTSPVTALHVFGDMKGKIPLILDGGKCSGGIESTVLDVTTETPIILRSGLVTAEMIKSVVGKCEYSKSLPTDKARAPGMKYAHYMPRCETALFGRGETEKAQKFYDEAKASGKTPYFLCDEEAAKGLCGNVLPLGRTAEEIASNLYYRLIEGEKKADVIIAIEVATGSGLDVGIMNRLSKACKKF
ncbi:MAG: threonylcarbamoyl-AMP synthase [Clostridia bacterium]|nr:threonylcarbamoyl-AMP synthase [Clostridia bacterium]